MTVTVPDGKHCSLKNTAVMTFPTAGTRFNSEAGDDSASATAKIPAKDCVKPERPQCEPGANEFRSESGACVCKTGYVRDDKGQCGGVIEPKLCPDGKPVPKSGRCPVPPVQCEPGPNEERDAQGQCVCKRGFERETTGRCVEAPDPEDECERKGWMWNDKPRPACRRSILKTNARSGVGSGTASVARLRSIPPTNAEKGLGLGRPSAARLRSIPR